MATSYDESPRSVEGTPGSWADRYLLHRSADIPRLSDDDRVIDIVGDSFFEDEIIASLEHNKYDVEKTTAALLTDNSNTDHQDDNLQFDLDEKSKEQNAKVPLEGFPSRLAQQLSQQLHPSFPPGFIPPTFDSVRPTPKPSTAFDFSGPSPDDIALAARAKPFKEKSATPKQAQPKSQKQDKTPQPTTPKQNTKPAKAKGKTTPKPVLNASTESLSQSAEVLVTSSGEIANVKTSTELKKQKKQMTPARRKEVLDAVAAQNREREEISLVVVGHVDAGKSTIMGHLLFKLGIVSKQAMHKFEKESSAIGKESFKYAWVMDEHDEERSRGVTIDVAVKHFSTKTKNVTLLDAPGHRDFIPNMISGASQADVAILVINAVSGEFESNLEAGQTREHALLLRSLGIIQLIVAVNKLDAVQWQEDRFNEIQGKLGAFLKAVGFAVGTPKVKFIPCSGLTGENLIDRSKLAALSWYQGPSLINAIDEFRVRERAVEAPFCLCITDVFKAPNTAGFTVSGKVENGLVTQGDNLLVVPLNEVCQVKSIRRAHAPADWALAGESVDLSIAGVDMEHLSVGHFLCDPERPIPFVKKFRAEVVTYRLPTVLAQGHKVELYLQSFHVPAVLSALYLPSKVEGEKPKRVRTISDDTQALLDISIDSPVCLTLYSEVKAFGRIMLREKGTTVAAGHVLEVLKHGRRVDQTEAEGKKKAPEK